MAKYSVNSNNSKNKSNTDESNRSSGGTCELCGTEADQLEDVSIEGARLNVCPDCEPSDDNKSNKTGTRDVDEPREKRTKEVINRATPNADEALPDSSWAEDGVGYNDDALPYLVKDYGKIVTEARKENNLSQEELADEIDVGVNIIRVIEQGQAASNDVGGQIIQRLEDVLDVTLEEET